MASNLPIPAPPRTPTPPPEDELHEGSGMNLDGYLNSPAKLAFDPNSLSPMDENFPIGRYGAAPAFPPPSASSNPLSPTDTNTSSQYSPVSLDSAGSGGSVMTENAKGVFKFQPTSLSTSPVAKSVSPSFDTHRCAMTADMIAERWPKTRSQIQAQQCLPPDLP